MLVGAAWSKGSGANFPTGSNHAARLVRCAEEVQAMPELRMDQPVLVEDGDLDAISQLLRGWQLDSVHLGRGSVLCSGVFVPLADMQLAIVHVRRAMVLRGRGPIGSVVLMSTSPASPPVRAGPRPIGGGTCLTLGSDARVELYLPANCCAFVLSLQIDTSIAQHATRLPVEGGAQLRSLTTDQSALLSRCMDLTESFRRSTSAERIAQVQHRLQELLTNSAVDLFAQSLAVAKDSSDKVARWAGVSRACAYIDEHLRESIALEDLCHFAGVRARTLEYGFDEFYDVGPMAYLRSVRLCRARHDLLRARHAAGMVATAARRWRFTHMGQFSRDYRVLFGESPSTTLGRGNPKLLPPTTPLELSTVE